MPFRTRQPNCRWRFRWPACATHRQPRSLRLSSAPRPSTACSSEMIAAVGGVGRLPVEQRRQQRRTGLRRPGPGWSPARRRVAAQSLAVQLNTLDLSGALRWSSDVVLGVACAAWRPRRRESAAAVPAVSNAGSHDGIQRHRPGQRDQPARRDRLTVASRAGPGTRSAKSSSTAADNTPLHAVTGPDRAAPSALSSSSRNRSSAICATDGLNALARRGCVRSGRARR